MGKFGMMIGAVAAALMAGAQPAVAATQIVSLNLFNTNPIGNCADTNPTAYCSPLGITAAGGLSNPFLNNLNTKTVALDKGSYYIFGNPWAGTGFVTQGNPLSLIIELEGSGSYTLLETFPITVPDLATAGTTLFKLAQYGITISTTGITDADRMGFGLGPNAFKADGNADFVLRLDYGVSPPSPAAVPEPATWLLLIGGFALIGAALRRRSAQLRPA